MTQFLPNGLGPSTGTPKSPPTVPTIDLPEDVILASLHYSAGNDKWVNRAKDESSNKLHVLIKPMLEQWEKLNDDSSCTPTKSRMKKTQSAGIADSPVLRDEPDETAGPGGEEPVQDHHGDQSC